MRSPTTPKEIRNPQPPSPSACWPYPLIYSTVAYVTLGTVSWRLAGSEMALSEAAARMLPGWGRR